jgi:SAM-dependent methyltransferase
MAEQDDIALFSATRAWADPEVHGMGVLHQSRMAAVLRELHDAGVRSVADLGCGSGALLARLVAEPRFERLIGLDASTAAIASASRQSALQPALQSGRLALHCASLADMPDRGACDACAEAVVLLETIEHIEPRSLSQAERAVFEGWRARTVIITTPNVEYNPLYGLPAGTLRHPDHRFEWGRAKFRAWAAGVALR